MNQPMSTNNDEETYSVIFAALKHPVRRRILRMLGDQKLTYTQLMTKLDLDTGHLNYYLESLGELLTKTDDGKYRLSEFGRAALGLMSEVEETETDRKATQKIQKSTQRIFRLGVLIAVIALVTASITLMNVSYMSTHIFGTSMSNEPRIIQPNGTIFSYDWFKLRSIHENTLTTHYQTFFQIEIAHSNVSLQIQLYESVHPMASYQAEKIGSYVQPPTLIYNETWNEPLENGTTWSYVIRVPLKTPKERGLMDANSFEFCNTSITNLGKETIVYDSFGNGTRILEPNYTGSLSLKTSYPVVEETNYPYFYVGIALLVVAAVISVLPFLPMLINMKKKKG